KTENSLRVSFIIGRFDHADQIVATHRKVNIFHLESSLLERFAAGIESLGARSDFRDSLLRPLQQRNVSWHGGSPFPFLFGVRRQSKAATALWINCHPKRCRAALATALQI